MNGNAELLQFICRNAEMGADTLNQLLEIIEDRELATHLKEQYNGYLDIKEKADTMLKQYGIEAKGVSKLDEAKTYLSINMQTMTDRSPSHIAEMVIIGSNMGVVDAIKNQRRYKTAEADILGLMCTLQKFEERNAETLKRFL